MEKKIEILRELEKNGRISISELASISNVCEDEINQILYDLEKEHIICGYSALINRDKTSNEVVTAIIEVKVKPQIESGFDEIANKISKLDEVNSIYLMSGNFDLMIMIEGKTVKEISAFVYEKLSGFDSIISTSTHFVLKKYKDHHIFITKNKKKRMLIGA